MYDELELDTLGDEKTALFLMMSDTDGSFNFLISMIYTQLFNLLCEKADDVYGGRLPVHVRCLIDEAANIGQIPNLEKLVATIRSREISACLVLQARSQLKAIYKDNADTIIGNMDCQVFLGGSEPTTLKELSEALGKETIDTFNTSDTRGSSPSCGTNYQKLGKELMSRDELAVMEGSKCILQLRGVRPFLSEKYDLTQHPNYKYTADFDKKLTFDIEKYLDTRAKLHPSDEFFVISEQLASHAMADIDPTFASTVEKGDIIVAGQNFGCGSSREHAPLCLKTAGVKCVIAKSFARIFYRNSINIGFPIMECEEAADKIEKGDEVEVDFSTGVITNKTKNETYQSQPFPEFLQKMIDADGLVNYVNSKK